MYCCFYFTMNGGVNDGDAKRFPTKSDPIETEILFLPKKKKRKKRLKWKAGTMVDRTPDGCLRIFLQMRFQKLHHQFMSIFSRCFIIFRVARVGKCMVGIVRFYGNRFFQCFHIFFKLAHHCGSDPRIF
jgi:hypothetical protein